MKVGANVDRRGSYDVAELATAHVKVVRLPLLPDFDARPWMMRCRETGLEIMAVIDSDSVAGQEWADAAATYARKYADLVNYWQPGNEPDHESPSSWTLAPADLNRLLRVFRDALPDAYLIGPGLVGGEAKVRYLDGVDLSLVDAIALHPYGRRPAPDWPNPTWGTGYVDDLLAIYGRHLNWSKPFWITEVGLSVSEVSTALQAEYVKQMFPKLAEWKTVGALWFCWSDWMGVPKYGLHTINHKPRPALATFAEAARIFNAGDTGPVRPKPVPPAKDPWQFWTAEQIAAATGCPAAAVAGHWPVIHYALDELAIADTPVQIAAIATTAIETASTFRPIHEFQPWPDHYGGGSRYHGRGYIQLTHDYNYRTFGAKPRIDRDLVADPDLALDPSVAAWVLAWYFKDRSVAQSARDNDWTAVRRKVQGGTAGLDRLVQIVGALRAAPPAPPAGRPHVFPVVGYTGPVNLHWGQAEGIGASDIFAPKGTPVVAMSPGRVIGVGANATGGNWAMYRGDDGLDYYYAHGDRYPELRLGDRVEPGRLIFGVGDSGNAAGKGAHLHIGIGHGIRTGSGVQGGAGINYDAVDLLRRVLAREPVAPPEPPAMSEAEHLRHALRTMADLARAHADELARIRDQYSREAS